MHLIPTIRHVADEKFAIKPKHISNNPQHHFVDPQCCTSKLIHNVAHQNWSTLNIISSRMCQQGFWRDHGNLCPDTCKECELTTQHARRIYNYMQNYLQRVHSWWDHSLLWTNLYKLPGIVWPSHSPSQSCPANPLWSVTKACSWFLTLPQGRVPRKLDTQLEVTCNPNIVSARCFERSVKNI